MDWSHLRSFLAIARTGRITVAARQLGVTHSTLSRHLSALEASAGLRLFDRFPSGFILTAAGERLLASVDAVDSLLGQATADLSQANLKVSGLVRIGAPDGFGVRFLASRLPLLGRQHPDLELQLITMPRFPSLSRREADIGIGLARPEEGRLHARKLIDYTLGLYASKEYVAACGAGGIEAVEGHGLVGYIDELLSNRELDYLPLLARDLRPRMQSSNLLAQMEMILAGGGIGVLPLFVARQEPRLMRVKPEFSLDRSFWMIVHTDMKDLARVRATMEFIAEEVRKARGLFMEEGLPHPEPDPQGALHDSDQA